MTGMVVEIITMTGTAHDNEKRFTPKPKIRHPKTSSPHKDEFYTAKAKTKARSKPATTPSTPLNRIPFVIALTASRL